MKDLTKYPKTDLFYVKDTIGVPHLYCITPLHITHASDKYYGILHTAAIKDLENRKARGCCGVKGCNLLYEEHEQALLIAVKSGKTLEELKPDLQEYLMSIKDMAEADGFAGFAFTQEADDAGQI